MVARLCHAMNIFGGLWCAETQLKLSYRAGVLAWFREV